MTRWDELVAKGPADEGAREAAVEDLLGELTLEEKLSCLSGDRPVLAGLLADARRYNALPFPAGRVPRLGIPGILFSDGPRGVVMGHSTAFPVSIARGATFDPELERRVGDTIGVECRAQGANLFGGVCINLLRHPAWGRAQETYGEDGHLLGEMGVALVEGAQRHVMATVKHYALNSLENSRFVVDVTVDDETLNDVYLPHFRRCVDAGVAAVMSAYNKVNGQWCGHHRHLLRAVLKERWGFRGFVMSDFVLGVRDGVDAIEGGQDLEMPLRIFFRSLGRGVRSGRIALSRIDDSVRRLLRQQLRFATVGEPERYRPEAVGCAEHRRLAKAVSDRAVVLLQNDPVRPGGAPLLPLDGARTRRVALVGRLAAVANTGDHGSSWVRARGVLTVADGLRASGERHGVHVEVSPSDDVRSARRAAADADAVIVVAGYDHRDEGEFLGIRGGDRRSLRLPSRQERLIEAVAALSPNTLVVLEGGSAIVCESWRSQVPAILMAWYPGSEGGRSVADIVFGDVAPSGRLPCTWARSEAQLPPFRRWARRIHYGPLVGYRVMAAEQRQPRWWFGHGLGYTTFDYGTPRLEPDAVVVPVTNTGRRRGEEVVQLYVDVALGSDRRPVPTLCAFRRVALDAGERAEARLAPEAWLLARAESSGAARLRVGRSADPAGLVEVKPA